MHADRGEAFLLNGEKLIAIAQRHDLEAVTRLGLDVRLSGDRGQGRPIILGLEDGDRPRANPKLSAFKLDLVAKLIRRDHVNHHDGRRLVLAGAEAPGEFGNGRLDLRAVLLGQLRAHRPKHCHHIGRRSFQAADPDHDRQVARQ